MLTSKVTGIRVISALLETRGSDGVSGNEGRDLIYLSPIPEEERRNSTSRRQNSYMDPLME